MEFSPVDAAAVLLGGFIAAWLTYKALRLLWATFVLAAKLAVACAAGALLYKCLEYRFGFEEGASSYWKRSLLLGAARDLGDSLEPLERLGFSGANATLWEIYRSVQGARTLWDSFAGWTP